MKVCLSPLRAAVHGSNRDARRDFGKVRYRVWLNGTAWQSWFELNSNHAASTAGFCNYAHHTYSDILASCPGLTPGTTPSLADGRHNTEGTGRKSPAMSQIEQAVAFLRDPRATQHSLQQRIDFLRTKGLSQASIDQALERVSGRSGGGTARHVVADETIEANGGLLEYSVVYTDRALNHMSTTFMGVMTDLHAGLTKVYNTDHAVLIPGSGTYGMEAVARQFGEGRKVLVIRNGYFSYRWSQLFDSMGSTDVTVLKAAPDPSTGQYRPPPIAEVVATIHRERPSLVCAPHVEVRESLAHASPR